jgi:hypothetical protein
VDVVDVGGRRQPHTRWIHFPHDFSLAEENGGCPPTSTTSTYPANNASDEFPAQTELTRDHRARHFWRTTNCLKLTFKHIRAAVLHIDVLCQGRWCRSSDDDIYELGWLMEDYMDSLIGETVRSFHNLTLDDQKLETLEACKS